MNVADEFARFREPWQPKIIGQLNDCYIKAVKTKGEFLWHDHQT